MKHAVNHHHRMLRFHMRTHVAAMSLVSLLFGLVILYVRPVAQFGWYPGLLGLASCSCFLVAVGAKSAGVAWALLGLGVQLSLLNVADYTVYAAGIVDTSTAEWPGETMREALDGIIAQGLTVPMLVGSVSLVYVLVRRTPMQPFLLLILAAFSACTIWTLVLVYRLLAFSLGGCGASGARFLYPKHF